MTKVAPYYTETLDCPRESRNVYHNHDDCPNGTAIKPWHRQAGDGKKPYCKACKKLG